MNKKVNSILFILGATIANIIVMTVIFFVLLILFARFLAPVLPAWANQLGLLVLFVGSVVVTYLIYHRFMKWLSQKYPLEQYFGHLFKQRRR